MLIEVQYYTEHDYLMRLLLGPAKGARYSNVSKVISISILYFDFCAGDDYIYRGTTEFFGLHNNHKLELNTEQQSMFDCETVAGIFPEHYIINVRNFDDIAKEPLDEWIYFLKHEEVKEGFHAKGLLEAKEKLDVLKLTSAEKAAYDRHIHELRREASLYESSFELGELKGIEQGFEKAEAISNEKHHAKTVESVKTMLNMGISIAGIVKITQLPEEEIKQLQLTL
jgi:predicted transposase/invertase (TIGR01784 family)